MNRLLCKAGQGNIRRIGLGYAWYNQGVGDERPFISMFKERFFDTQIQTGDMKLKT